jgi:hypothetical protein
MRDAITIFFSAMAEYTLYNYTLKAHTVSVDGISLPKTGLMKCKYQMQ